MTVAELIAELQKMPQNKIVILRVREPYDDGAEIIDGASFAVKLEDDAVVVADCLSFDEYCAMQNAACARAEAYIDRSIPGISRILAEPRGIPVAGTEELPDDSWSETDRHDFAGQ